MNALDLLIDFANSRSTSATQMTPTDIDRNHDDPGSQPSVLKAMPQELHPTSQKPHTPDDKNTPLEWTHIQQFAPSPASHEHLIAAAFAEANANMLRERRVLPDWASDRTHFEQRHHPTQPFHRNSHLPITWMPDYDNRAYFGQGPPHQFHPHPPNFSHGEQVHQHPYDQHPPWANSYTPGCTVRLDNLHREAYHPPPTFQESQMMMQYPMQEMSLPYEYLCGDGRYQCEYLPVQEHRAIAWRDEGRIWT
jgi:hypothetical protein